MNANGGQLQSSGVASVASDSLVLSGSGMPNGAALYFQGTTQLAGGLGFVFGDGLRCAGGTIRRLGVEINAGGASQYPGGGDMPISIVGAVSPGAARMYQGWYRNAPVFRTSATYNLTNGLRLTWQP